MLALPAYSVYIFLHSHLAEFLNLDIDGSLQIPTCLTALVYLEREKENGGKGGFLFEYAIFFKIWEAQSSLLIPVDALPSIRHYFSSP